MSSGDLHAFLQRERAHAAASFRLDEELGTHHGLSWADFVLLEALADAPAGMADGELATRLGLLRSQFLRRVRPLEKVGLVTRTPDDRGRPLVALSASGRRSLREARETAEMVCAGFAD